MAPDAPENGHEPIGPVAGMLEPLTPWGGDPEVIVEPWAPATRKPRAWWDRIKLLAVLAVAWGLLLWYSLSNDPLLSVQDALHQAVRAKWWIEILFALESLR